MTLVSPRKLSQAIDGFVKRRNHQGTPINQGALKSVGDAEHAKMPLLFEHVEGINQHKTREQSSSPGEKHTAPKLGEGVMPPIGSYDIMGSLRTTVIAHNCVSGKAAG